jgi:hypothetical protein
LGGRKWILDLIGRCVDRRLSRLLGMLMLYSSMMILSASFLRIDISYWIHIILHVFFSIKLDKINLFGIYNFVMECTLINDFILVFNYHLTGASHIIRIIILNRWLSF